MFFHKVHAAIIKIASCFSELAYDSSVLVLIWWSEISTVYTAYLPDYLSVSYDYATGNFNMPILYALEYMPPYGNFLQISWQVELNPICIVFSLVWTQSSIKDGTLCENVSQLEGFNNSSTS